MWVLQIFTVKDMRSNGIRICIRRPIVQHEKVPHGFDSMDYGLWKESPATVIPLGFSLYYSVANCELCTFTSKQWDVNRAAAPEFKLWELGHINIFSRLHFLSCNASWTWFCYSLAMWTQRKLTYVRGIVDHSPNQSNRKVLPD